MKQHAQIGIIGGGSWATALAKMLTDNGNVIHWWMRNADIIKQIATHGSNPKYLCAVHFDTKLLQLTDDLRATIERCSIIVLAVPSNDLQDALLPIRKGDLNDKIVLSAIKGLIPEAKLVNKFLFEEYGFPVESYYTVMGPCHAEEVATEKLSYLTFSGYNIATAKSISSYFKTSYINCIVNCDIRGVQYAAVVKNIYALGAGIAHGLGYGDNFLSVYIANCVDEMASFLVKEEACLSELEKRTSDPETDTNYSASVYLGDLLVTCYSPHSRNRTFGTMLGKGYSVKAASVEIGMIPEGYNASKSIHKIQKDLGISMFIAETVYRILWERLSPNEGFAGLEKIMF